jgi:hypothetical protein
MNAKLAKSTEVSPQGIPLDLGALLAPYQHHKQLSVRVEQLPQLARLSKGRNNGDCTFSLKLDELLGLVYLPPPGSNGAPITLAVRILNLDDDYATTLALIDQPVPPEPNYEDGAKRKLRVVDTSGDIEDEANGEPAEPAALQAIHVKRTDASNELEGELSDLHQQLETSTKDDEETYKQALQSAEAALARDFVEQIAAAKEQLEREFADRLAQALNQAEENKAETEADRAQANSIKELEEEISRLRQQLDTAATTGDNDIEEVRKQAIESTKAAETAHAREITELQGSHARALEVHDAATREQLKQEFTERLAEIQSQAEEKIGAQATAADKRTEEAEAKSVRALAKATKTFEDELSRLRQQLESTATELGERQQNEIEAVKTVHAAEITALQSTHAGALEAQAAATQGQIAADEARFEQESAERLAQALEQTEAKAEARLTETRQTLEAEAASALSTARETWQAEEAERFAAAEQKFVEERAQLRQQHENANSDVAEMRKQAIEAVKTEHAAALEAQVAATKELLEAEFTERLTVAQHQAVAEAEAALSTARETWQAEETVRLEAAQKVFGDELAQLRQQHDSAATVDADIEELRQQSMGAAEAAKTAHAAEIADLKSAHARALEELASTNEKPSEPAAADDSDKAVRAAEDKIEARLTKARQVWQSDTAAKLASAREIWQAEEAQRLAAAKAAWQGHSQGPTTRERAYRQQLNWMPRRAHMVTIGFVCLIGFALLLPGVRSLALEGSTTAITGLKGYIGSLRTPPPVIEPATVEAPQTSPGATAARPVVNVTSANVRAGPSADAQLVQSLPRGSAVSVLGSEQGWHLIRFGDGAKDVGWVFSDLLSAP